MRTFKKLAITVALFAAASSSCALIDALKKGSICFSPEGAEMFPEQVQSHDASVPGCSKHGDSSFVSDDLLTSMVLGETRTITINVVQNAASGSDRVVTLSVASLNGGSLPSGASVTLPAAADLHRTNDTTPVRITIAADKTMSGAGFDFRLDANGVEGTGSIAVHVLVRSPFQTGGGFGDDLATDDGRLILLSDCALKDAKWGRLVKIDPANLAAATTIYAPPARAQAQNCGDNGNNGNNPGNCGGQMVLASLPGNNNGGFCNGSCPGVCPSALALEAPVAGKNRTALLGISSHILRIDTVTGEATKIAEVSGVPLRIVAEDPNHAVVLVSKQSSLDDMGGNAQVPEATIIRVDTSGKSSGEPEVLVPSIVASDLAKLAGTSFAVLGHLSLSEIDLAKSATGPMDQVTGGFKEIGFRIAPFADMTAVLTSNYDRIDLATGRITSQFPMPGLSLQNNGSQGSTVHNAFVFSPLANDRIIAERSIVRQNGGAGRSGQLEAVVRGSTAASTLIPSNFSNFVPSIAVDAAGDTAYVVTPNAILKYDPGSGAMIGSPVNLPSTGMGPGHNFQKVVLEPGETTALAVDNQGGSLSVERIDLASGATTDLMLAGCPADIAFDADGALLVLDPIESAIVRVELSTQRRTVIANLDFGSTYQNCGATSANVGSAGIGLFGLAIAPGPDRQPAAWFSQVYGPLVAVNVRTGEKTVVYSNYSGTRLAIDSAHGRALMIDTDGGLVSIALDSGARTRIAFRRAITALALHGGSAYVASSEIAPQGQASATYFETIPSP